MRASVLDPTAGGGSVPFEAVRLAEGHSSLGTRHSSLKLSARELAKKDYQERMAAIFAECRRVLKPNGIMTLLFTHKATGAGDALTKGLMEAGFTITASWPSNTEAEGSLHIKDKAAANSTIFLACRPRVGFGVPPLGGQASGLASGAELHNAQPAKAGTPNETAYWEDVEPQVASAVRRRVAEFQAAGIRGVDLYLASFSPALEEFSEHWPLKRGTPNPLPPALKRAQKDLFPEEWDPYAVSPEDALDAARREVKRWRLEQLTHRRARTELDARTSWFVLAGDAYQAPGMAKPVRIITRPDYLDEYGDSVGLWSPGSPLFPSEAGNALPNEGTPWSVSELLVGHPIAKPGGLG